MKETLMLSAGKIQDMCPLGWEIHNYRFPKL